jgi:hypothetical protein
VPIIGGGRLTGRSGPYTLGLMNISTDAETLAGRELDRANFTVLRLKRNVLKSSNIGVLVANSQDGISAYNRAVESTARFVLGRYVTMTGVIAGTFSPDASGRDVAGVLDFAWKSDRFNYGGQYLDVGEQFNAEMGYVPRLDVRATKVKGNGRRVRAAPASVSSSSTPTSTITRITPAWSTPARRTSTATCCGRTPRRCTSAPRASTTTWRSPSRRPAPSCRWDRTTGSTPRSATTPTAPGASTDRSARISAAITTAIAGRCARVRPSRRARRCSSSRTTRTTA